jgi:hypothetical protein
MALPGTTLPPVDPPVVPPTPDGGSVPTYSTDDDEIWYYIQFVNTGYAIEQHGTDLPMTVEVPIEDEDAQLWKVEFEKKTTSSTYANMDVVAISNKADPALKIRYISGGLAGNTDSGFYATATTGSYGSDTGSAYGNPILVTNYNSTDHVTINARNSNYNIRPRTMGADGLGSDVYRDGSSNPNKADCEIRFVLPENLFPATGIQTPQDAPALIASVSDNILKVSGLFAGESLRVYNLQGIAIYDQIARTTEQSLDLPARGVYVVVAGNRVIKAVY